MHFLRRWKKTLIAPPRFTKMLVHSTMAICDMVNKLKTMDMAISNCFVLHFIMTSLPPQYSPFKISYNTHKAT